MMGSLYSTQKRAGADEDNSKNAAEKVANFEGRVNGLETRIDRMEARLEARIDSRFGILEARITTLTWMVGIVMTMLFPVLGGLLGLLWKLFPTGGLS